MASPPDDVLKVAIADALRLLHASIAPRLASTIWTAPPEFVKPTCLIEDGGLQEAYAELIGKIAASHWLPTKSLRQEFSVLQNAPSFLPGEWTVDPLKVACLLRVADAAHIDSARAPTFRLCLARPQGVSLSHWTAQNKISPARVDERFTDALRYTSRPFAPEEAAAWWQSFALVNVADRELRDVDLLLQEHQEGALRFRARRVLGAEAAESLEKYITVEGWRPVDVCPRTSDARGIIRMLGGHMLYGPDPAVAVRELIQNASDAIRLYRVVTGRGQEYGKIVVRVDSDAEGTWLRFCDNGVGMSLAVIKGELLDFGASLSGGKRLMEEFPGALGKGYRAAGRFGIGFFTVFMLGQNIKVVTRRFDADRASAYVVEFQNGLADRPIVRLATNEDFAYLLQEFGTTVSVRVVTDEMRLMALGQTSSGSFGKGVKRVDHGHLIEVIKMMCPALDIDLDIVSGTISQRVISCDDWKSISAEALLSRFLPERYVKSIIESFEKQYGGLDELLCIIDDPAGKTYGRACVRPLDLAHLGFELDDMPTACIANLGLTVGNAWDIVGVIVSSEPNNVLRNSARVLIPDEAWDRWVAAQERAFASKLPEDKIIEFSWVLAMYSDRVSIPIGCLDGKYVSIYEVFRALQQRGYLELLEATDKMSGHEKVNSTQGENFLCTFNLNLFTYGGLRPVSFGKSGNRFHGFARPLVDLIIARCRDEFGERFVIENQGEPPPNIRELIQEYELPCCGYRGRLRLNT